MMSAVGMTASGPETEGRIKPSGAGSILIITRRLLKNTKRRRQYMQEYMRKRRAQVLS